jgi:hypothetical protein
MTRKPAAAPEKPQPQEMSISHCTFNAKEVPMTKEQAESVLALSHAVRENAAAIKEIAIAIKELALGLRYRGPDALLKIGRID